MSRYFLSTFFILTCFFGISQKSQRTVIYDQEYVDYIKSVELKKKGTTFSYPIVDLRGGKLTLSFDDLDPEDKQYIYEIYRCNKDWETSPLNEIEYIDGFNGEEIRDFWYSENTRVDFTHYRLDIPNDDIRWTRSGNYVIVVYEEFDDGKEPILARRFMVTEDRIKLTSRFISPINARFVKSHHSLDMTIDHKNFPITDPMNEISLTVMQNGRWDNAQSNVYPRFTKPNEILFNYLDGFVFPGIKEFRVFDTRSIRTSGENIHSIELNEDGADVLLDLDFIRSGDNHLVDNDINGQFFIWNDDDPRVNIGGSLRGNDRERIVINANTSADYTNVIFTLKSKKLNHDVYVVGKFTNWSKMPEYLMEYDESRGIYICEGLLKQGRYEYLIGEDIEGNLDFSYTEGSRFETENEYTILVYYSEFASRHDRLIDVITINSNYRP